MKESVKKWIPILEQSCLFPDVKNKYVFYLICEYCEFMESISYGQTQSIPFVIEEIKMKLSKIERIEIEDKKYFNPIKMCFEYKTTDGEYIGDLDSQYEVSIEFLIDLFGMDFIKTIPELTQRLRERKITNIVS